MNSQPPAQMCARDQVSLPNSITACPPPSPTRPESSILTDSHPLTTENHQCHCTGEKLSNQGQVITIDMLPDEALLEIFDFYLDEDAFKKKDIEAWQLLVHVCQRWRCVVFGSPRRLNLRLHCGPETHVRDKLDVWPPLPLDVCGHWRHWQGPHITSHVDNIITLLERRNRVSRIELIHDLPLERILPALQEPFPELTHFVLDSSCRATIALPDSFLGGSAPRLRKLRLCGVPFPGLPNLLLSAIHLVDLQLSYISYSGNLLPEALVTALSTLTCLRTFVLRFRSPRSYPDRARRPPPTRSLLPVLNGLRIVGVGEYIDDLVARIDAPHLNDLEVTFFHQYVPLDTPQFTQFISRTLTLEALEKASVAFQSDSAAVKLSSQTSSYGELKVKILCFGSTQQVSTLKRFCTSYLPLSTAEDVYIYGNINLQGIETALWLELLHVFASVKNLYLSKDAALYIGLALQELVEEITTEVLPIVQTISLEDIQPRGPVLEGIEKFIAARQFSSHPVTISTNRLSETDLARLMFGWVFGFDHS